MITVGYAQQLSGKSSSSELCLLLPPVAFVKAEELGGEYNDVFQVPPWANKVTAPR